MQNPGILLHVRLSSFTAVTDFVRYQDATVTTTLTYTQEEAVSFGVYLACERALLAAFKTHPFSKVPPRELAIKLVSRSQSLLICYRSHAIKPSTYVCKLKACNGFSIKFLRWIGLRLNVTRLQFSYFLRPERVTKLNFLPFWKSGCLSSSRKGWKSNLEGNRILNKSLSIRAIWIWGVLSK